jgi:oligopeptide/dipeptide ABC transporter ATP-binding protein
MTAPLLKISNLHVWFDLGRGRELHAVRGVSLSLERGDRIGLVGESGCGKTSAMLALMGLLPASASVAGAIRLEGEDILAGGEKTIACHRWCEIAMVFQGAMNALNPVKRISDQITEPMRLHGVASGIAARARCLELLELVGIPRGRADAYPHELSGGMRQRVAIAMALSCDPKILLADEPTTALDVMVQAQILELLERLTIELGLTLLLVTHDLPVVAQTCTRAAVLYAGQVVESATVDALYHAPLHPYTRLLFSAIPTLERSERVASIRGNPPHLDHEPEGCAFADRCHRAYGPCSHVEPVDLIVAEGHSARCHLHDAEHREAS